ncbi:hypothetical protein AB0K00_32070 [Dactylosporangium sp. NPDC049525]|uniref:hypothetical protein n=1 Tax=Dactylosporangium sp. NPDC049525 TaxID=3154730 RepID=UPI00343A232B
MNETAVRALLIRGTEDRPPGIDLIAAVPAVPARWERRHSRVLMPLGVAAAVVLAVSMTVLALPVGQPSAQAQVVAAVENTSRQSYRIHGTSGTRAFEGAFDPVQRVGVITTVGEGAETRFVGDLMYVRRGGTTWEVSPRMEVADAPMAVTVVKLVVLDPAQTLQRLRSATDIREDGAASGDGWTGTRFTFSLTDKGEPKPAGGSRTITGAVDVDNQDRIRRVQLDFNDSSARNVVTFGDFGVPVTVTAPPASEVEQPPTSKQSGDNAAKSSGEPRKK